MIKNANINFMIEFQINDDTNFSDLIIYLLFKTISVKIPRILSDSFLIISIGKHSLKYSKK